MLSGDCSEIRVLERCPRPQLLLHGDHPDQGDQSHSLLARAASGPLGARTQQEDQWGDKEGRKPKVKAMHNAKEQREEADADHRLRGGDEDREARDPRVSESTTTTSPVVAQGLKGLKVQA